MELILYRKTIFLTIILLFCWVINLTSEEDKIKKKYQTGIGSENTRTSISLLNKMDDENDGWQKYVRLSKHDGNLVETGWVNQGQLADGYVSGSAGWPMIWPKGSGIEYGYVFVFCVVAEVTDIHNNLIHISSDRFHRSDIEQSPDKTHWFDFKPLPKYFNNHHLSSSDWDIGGISEDVGIDGVPNTNDIGEADGELQPAEDFNRNGVLDVSMINVTEWAAMSHLQETWPEWWPPQSYEGDDRAIGEERPGPAAGRWNGEYGYYIRSDQESYYLMDDRENDEFEYYPFNLPGETVPDTRPWPEGRRGLGITVKVRNYQWNARLAEDLMISIYDITNYGKKLNKVVVGMYSDVDVGGSSGGDDADFDTFDDITYVWDKSGLSGQGLPTGYFGFAFLESPGLSQNRIDDDQDGMIDESQYNLEDEDKDWVAWEDVNENGQWDTEDLNFNDILDPGEDLNGNNKLDWEPLWDDIGSDGIGPDNEGYGGPDMNGSETNGRPDQGEPNFGKTDNDESDQVGLTSWYLKDVDSRVANDEEFWEIELQPGTFGIDEEYTRDVAFSYGSGFIELVTGKAGTQRFAIATLFGNDEQDIFRNKRTMQRIYDADYNFSKAPRLPILTSIASDKRVVLMWDKGAENSKDPIYGNDFAMYKIYKSTDPNFQNIKTISDAYGNPLLYKPIAQFDLKDGLFGPHPIQLGDLGISYDMGLDNGLQHSLIDTNVTNGRTYYYAVVAVDKGYDHDFFERGLSDRDNLAPNAPTECSAIIQTDPLGRPTYIARNCAVVIPTESSAGYIEPDTESGVEHISGIGTGTIKLEVMIPDSIDTDHEYQIVFEDDGSIEKFDSLYKTGLTNSVSLIDVTVGDTLFASDYTSESINSADNIISGFRININNDDSVNVDWAGWVTGRSNVSGEPLGYAQQTKAIPRDYRIYIDELGIDSSYSAVPGRAIKTNFTVLDITDPDNEFNVIFGLSERDDEPDSLKGILSHGDEIAIKAAPLVIQIGEEVIYIYTETSWRISFNLPTGIEATQQIIPVDGDVYEFTTKKPFDRHDVFEFKIIGGVYSDSYAQSNMDNIYTVPDPYIAASSLEPKLVNLDLGRGERRIDFVNLPHECKISIFTVAGRLVREIDHSSTIENGRESWDLRTSDGLEVAHGIYIYYVDAPGVGSKTGKLAIIK